MDVGVKSNKKTTGIQKHVFSRKSLRKDGLLLQVHHTLTGHTHPIRFLHAAFQESTDTLAVSDVKGNIFIIDLMYNRFWALPNVVECSAIAFSPNNKSEILVSSTGCSVKIINFENGKEMGRLQGHTLPPSQLTFGGEGGKWLLSAAPCPFKRKPEDMLSPHRVENTGEALVWDINSCAQAHCLNVRQDSGIKKAMFMEGVSSGQILVCFEDDAMFVWQFGKFECMKQILPVTWKGQHNLRSIAFTRNGRAMVVGGKSHSLVVFSLDTWAIEKVIELPDGICGIKHLQFLPQPFDGGSNRVLAILSNNAQVYFLDLHSSSFIGSIINAENNKICKLVCSPSGRYVACVLQSGVVNIYCSTKLLENGFVKEEQVSAKITGSEQVIKIERIFDKTSSDINNIVDCKAKTEQIAAASRRKSQHLAKKHFHQVTQEIRSELDPKRLLPMLRQVGEFPSRYRTLAWRTALLQLPCNRKAYASLVTRGIHPSYTCLEQKYPLENQSELKSLKRLLSCLAHWSPLFSQVNYLPLFTYPFVKLFVRDPFSCFEVVATVIMNYCQHWFEFFPFPPINVLAAIENLLAYHDPDLLQFFIRNGIDTRVYAWPMLQVAFSEVLSNEEWLRLWDHILANEPAIILAAVPAYCIVCRSALFSCKNIEDFQFFFQNQNPINMDRFISKLYSICHTTPAKLHPRQYLQESKSISEGDTYPVFNQYPKFLVDGHAENLQQIQEEEDNIIREELAAVKILKEKEEQKKLADNAYLQQKHLAELEKAYQLAILLEEEKIGRRHLELLNLKKELAETEDVAKNVKSSREDEAKTSMHFSLTRQHLRDRGQKVKLQENEIMNLKQEIKNLKKQLQESGLCKGKESSYQCRTGPGVTSAEVLSILSESEEEPIEEYKGWFGAKKNISESEDEHQKYKKNKQEHNGARDGDVKQKEMHVREKKQDQLTHGQTDERGLRGKFIHRLLRESKISKKTKEDDEIAFIREVDEQRWQIDPSNSRDVPSQKNLDLNDFQVGRNNEFYHEEQAAIKRAMESRARILSLRDRQIPDSTSAVT